MKSKYEDILDDIVTYRAMTDKALVQYCRLELESRIESVKFIKAVRGIGLREAKDILDTFWGGETEDEEMFYVVMRYLAAVGISVELSDQQKVKLVEEISRIVLGPIN